MKHRKVLIIGAGHVGSHAALSLALDRTAEEVVLVDKDMQKAEAHALDIYDAMSFSDHSVLVRAGDYADAEDADVIIIAIGESRKPGQDRVDMMADSIVMCKELTASLKPYNISGIVISITNPCDVIADYLRKALGIDDRRMFGTGTLLDTARLLRVLSLKTGVSRDSIQGFVMGEHGESSMIPYSRIHIGGLRYADFSLSDEEVLHDVRRGGWIVMEGKKCTEFGIGRAAAYLTGVILRGEKKILPVSANLHGEYGEDDVMIGVPCVIGGEGIEKVLEVSMTDGEKEQFHHSCEVVRGNIAKAALI